MSLPGLGVPNARNSQQTCLLLRASTIGAMYFGTGTLCALCEHGLIANSNR